MATRTTITKLLSITAISLFSLNANSALITFDDVDSSYKRTLEAIPYVGSPGAVIPTPQGFLFSALFVDYLGSDLGPFVEVNCGNGSACMTAVSPSFTGPNIQPLSGTPITMTHSSGQAFNLDSLDILNIFAPNYDPLPPAYAQPQPITIQAFDTDDNMVAELTLTNDTGATFWDTLLLNNEWHGVSSVVINPHTPGGGIGFGLDPLPIYIDNINATVVPLPAAAWLFLSALGLLGLKRQKAAGIR